MSLESNYIKYQHVPPLIPALSAHLFQTPTPTQEPKYSNVFVFFYAS